MSQQAKTQHHYVRSFLWQCYNILVSPHAPKIKAYWAPCDGVTNWQSEYRACTTVLAASFLSDKNLNNLHTRTSFTCAYTSTVSVDFDFVPDAWVRIITHPSRRLEQSQRVARHGMSAGACWNCRLGGGLAESSSLGCWVCGQRRLKNAPSLTDQA